MKHSWKIIGSKFEALNLRERWMVACALLVVVYAAINMLLLGPVLERQKILNRELEADQLQIQDLNQQIGEFSRQPVIDPDAQNKQHIAELQSHLQLLETRLSDLQTTLISPDKMPELLRSLLKKNGNLKLIELKTLPVKGLLESSAESTEQAPKQDVPVFKHGVEITIEGRYLDLLEYVTELEKMPWHVLWSKAALNAEHYPDSQLTLTVYTLSLDQTWLSI
ncbi:MAG TPA: MSHA biogenesis protein MshJ [Methylotenera sp.]|nr:MSHA biogenesis protein MshJ [Methylotenera sp.]HPV44028.1 MSHA biogenesis protein MshJ [Methylotenera sp.]